MVSSPVAFHPMQSNAILYDFLDSSAPAVTTFFLARAKMQKNCISARLTRLHYSEEGTRSIRASESHQIFYAWPSSFSSQVLDQTGMYIHPPNRKALQNPSDTQHDF